MAKTLRPPIDTPGFTNIEVDNVIIIDGNVALNNPQALFDDKRGSWNSAETVYFNSASCYVTIQVSSPCTIWELLNPSYYNDYSKYSISKMNENGTFTNISSECPDLINNPQRNVWNKIFEIPDAGTYKISSSRRIVDEWFIEAKQCIINIQYKTIDDNGNEDIFFTEQKKYDYSADDTVTIYPIIQRENNTIVPDSYTLQLNKSHNVVFSYYRNLKLFSFNNFKYAISQLFRNKPVLDKLSSDENGILLYDGKEITNNNGSSAIEGVTINSIIDLVDTKMNNYINRDNIDVIYKENKQITYLTEIPIDKDINNYSSFEISIQKTEKDLDKYNPTEKIGNTILTNYSNPSIKLQPVSKGIFFGNGEIYQGVQTNNIRFDASRAKFPMTVQIMYYWHPDDKTKEETGLSYGYMAGSKTICVNAAMKNGSTLRAYTGTESSPLLNQGAADAIERDGICLQTIVYGATPSSYTTYIQGKTLKSYGNISYSARDYNYTGSVDTIGYRTYDNKHSARKVIYLIRWIGEALTEEQVYEQYEKLIDYYKTGVDNSIRDNLLLNYDFIEDLNATPNLFPIIYDKIISADIGTHIIELGNNTIEALVSAEKILLTKDINKDINDYLFKILLGTTGIVSEEYQKLLKRIIKIEEQLNL